MRLRWNNLNGKQSDIETKDRKRGSALKADAFLDFALIIGDNRAIDLRRILTGDDTLIYPKETLFIPPL